jgi:hypothetical protein
MLDEGKLAAGISRGPGEMSDLSAPGLLERLVQAAAAATEVNREQAGRSLENALALRPFGCMGWATAIPSSNGYEAIQVVRCFLVEGFDLEVL